MPRSCQVVTKMIGVIKVILIINIFISHNRQMKCSQDILPLNNNIPVQNKAVRADSCVYQKYIWLYCFSYDQELDIKSEIDIIYNAIPTQWERMFPLVQWSAPVLNAVLPEKVFQNFRLINIEFVSNNLEKIHTNAFSGIYAGTE